jgi:hypothetical protein
MNAMARCIGVEVSESLRTDYEGSMNQKPKPKELVIRRNSTTLDIYASSADAHRWIRENAGEFGRFFEPITPVAALSSLQIDHKTRCKL